MYHHYSKNDPRVRKALYEAYSKKCAYCGDPIQPKNMHVDHILATNAKKSDDNDFNQYIDELNSDGFILDSIENYRPSCAACNLKKNNKNFSVATLRFYHHEAREKSSKVLSVIAQCQTQDVSFDGFDPDYDYWEKIDFSHQKNISEAIAGYRLQPCHVCACPRLTQVEEIKKKLEIVDYVIVEGEPGCGKSISIYQAAYDLCNKGYIVYRYINRNAEDTIFLPQENDMNYLIVIDDAQNLPNFLIEKILIQAQKHTKIILAFTKLGSDNSLYPEPIRITNFDAVKAISVNYKQRKQEILPIVQKFDRNVGDGMMDISFESRIKNAATKNTPWLFNYTLRGGWSTTSAQFQTVYNHNQCGLLSAIIALLQILKMDNAIDFNWLQTYINKIDNKIVWTENDLTYLIQNKIIASFDDVRIVHIESAKSIIHNFYKLANKSLKELICKIIENGYQDRIFNELGLIWLQDVVSSSVYCSTEQLFTESLLDSVFCNLDKITDAEQRGHIVYLIERMFGLHRAKSGRQYFNQNENLLAQWLSQTTSKNAYSYSQLLNALNNERDGSLKAFASKINLDALVQNFSNSSIDDLYVWCKMFNRFSCAYNEFEVVSFGQLLKDSLCAKSNHVTTDNVVTFYNSLSEIFYLNQDLILQLLSQHIDKIQSLRVSNVEEVIEVFDFHFLEYVCGLSHFSLRKPTDQQRCFSKQFVKALSVKSIASYISQSLPRNWHRIFEIGRLLYRDNKKVYSQIVKAIDYDALNRGSSSLWKKTNGDLHLLFSFIAFGDKETAKQFFMKNIEKIEELGLPYIKFLPEQAIALNKKGVKIRLFENYWNDETFFALNALHDASETEYKNILNSEFSQLVSKISEFCILDFDKDGKTLYEILAYITETHPSVFSEVVPMLNFAKMKEEKLRMLNDNRCDRRSRRLFQKMIDILSEFSNETNIEELKSLKSLK